MMIDYYMHNNWKHFHCTDEAVQLNSSHAGMLTITHVQHNTHINNNYEMSIGKITFQLLSLFRPV